MDLIHIRCWTLNQIFLNFSLAVPTLVQKLLGTLVMYPEGVKMLLGDRTVIEALRQITNHKSSETRFRAYGVSSKAL